MYYGLFSIKYKCKFNSDRENKLRVSIRDKGILEFKYLVITAHFSRTDFNDKKISNGLHEFRAGISNENDVRFVPNFSPHFCSESKFHLDCWFQLSLLISIKKPCSYE